MKNIIKVNFDRNWRQSLDHLIQEQLAGGVFPGIEILFAVGEEIRLHQTWGYLELGPQASKLERNTVFDIASLTKPIATASLFLILLERGRLDLEIPASVFLPEMDSPDKRQITLKHLLTHTSGLPAWENLYTDSKTKEDAWQKLLKIPLQTETGTQTIYSCLGYLLLGEVIRRVSGQSLSNAFEQNLAVPLELKQTVFSPLNHHFSPKVIAPTQYCTYRNQLLRGIVHDENCYIFNEEGGNAGLFSTASDLYRFCLMILKEGQYAGKRVLSRLSVKKMLENHNLPPLAPRGLGWDRKEEGFGYWSCGDLFPAGSVGHTGFTGTSLWFDPVSQIIVIILTNRVHLTRDNNREAMRRFRPRIHNLLLSAI